MTSLGLRQNRTRGKPVADVGAAQRGSVFTSRFDESFAEQTGHNL